MHPSVPSQRCSLSRLCRAAGRSWLTALLICAPLVGQALEPDEWSSDWSLDFTVYGHIAGVSAETSQATGSGTVEADFGDLISNLKGGFFGITDFRWRRFGVLADISYMKLGDKTSLSGPFFVQSKVEFHSLVTTVAGYYRLLDTERYRLDVTAGARIYHVDIEQSLSGGVAPDFSFQGDTTLADPVFGARGRVEVLGDFFSTAQFDVGGGGSSDLVWQAWGGLGYALNDTVSLHAGYRHLSWDIDGGLLLEQQISGPLIGATIHFR